MTMRTTCGALAALLIGSSAVTTPAFADTMTMWVRASGTNAATHLVDLWNSTHPDKIELTTIPDNQMVTKLATGVQAGEVPDLVSFDLIYMPDFMKAGFLDRPHRRAEGRPELRLGRPGLPGHRDLRGQALRRRLHARRLDPRLEQGPVQEGRPRSRQAAAARSARSTTTPRRSARWARTPTASISPAPAPAATSSPPRR